MAGNPLAKLVPHIKKHAVILYIIMGPLLFLKTYEMTNVKQFKNSYSQNNFERRYHLEKLEEFIENEKLKKTKQQQAKEQSKVQLH